MYFSYFDTAFSSNRVLQKHIKNLGVYREHVAKVLDQHDHTQPEYSLVHAQDAELHNTLDQLKKDFKGIKHLILVGVGGSNLGTEAIHQLLGEEKVVLHTLDTISPRDLDSVLLELKRVKKLSQLAICVISKSGGTAETLVNASVLFDELEQQFGPALYQQTIFVGDPETEFLEFGNKLGATVVPMPKIVGGRYSVGTEVGLIPLALLGHDVDAFISGLLDASNEEYESVTSENAARLFIYMGNKYTHYNFFAFQPQLYKLGAWYRQLQAESLGKTLDKRRRKVTKGFAPTVSTSVELHSTGQLYMSGLLPVYTDFITFDDECYDFDIPKKGLAKKYSSATMQDVVSAMYGGVIGAYQTKKLPYRATIFSEDLPYSIGLFMGMRMRETMYIAHLLGVNAFDQPNVELYKDKTREILDI